MLWHISRDCKTRLNEKGAVRLYKDFLKCFHIFHNFQQDFFPAIPRLFQAISIFWLRYIWKTTWLMKSLPVWVQRCYKNLVIFRFTKSIARIFFEVRKGFGKKTEVSVLASSAEKYFPIYQPSESPSAIKSFSETHRRSVCWNNVTWKTSIQHGANTSSLSRPPSYPSILDHWPITVVGKHLHMFLYLAFRSLCTMKSLFDVEKFIKHAFIE